MLAVLAVAAPLAWTGAARAQPAVPQSPLAPLADDAAASTAHRTTGALRRVSSVCAADVARFCPELAAGATPRNRVICLRPYKFDLSLGCRGAVADASH